MCLSTVYRNTVAPEEVIMKNVMTIEQKDGVIILTDLMERQTAVEGTLEKANLVDGYVVTANNAMITNTGKNGAIRVTKVDVQAGTFEIGNFDDFTASKPEPYTKSA